MAIKRGRDSVCVCVCVREREREGEVDLTNVDNKRCEEKKLNRLWKLQVIIIRPILQKLYSIKVIVHQTAAED